MGELIRIGVLINKHQIGGGGAIIGSKGTKSNH